MKDYRSNRDVERIRDRLERASLPQAPGSNRYRYRSRPSRRSSGVIKTVGVVVAAAVVVIGPYWISGAPFAPRGSSDAPTPVVPTTHPKPESTSSAAALHACRGEIDEDMSNSRVTLGSDFLQIVLCGQKAPASLQAVTALNREWRAGAVARPPSSAVPPRGCEPDDAGTLPAVAVTRDHAVARIRYLACGAMVIDDFQLDPSTELVSALRLP